MPIVLKRFQREVCDGILARFANVRDLYDRTGELEAQQRPAQLERIRLNDAALVLQAPTGAGKTAIACTVLNEWLADERRVAELLDRHELVRWWHRNPSRVAGVSVGLYAWDDGDGFFPDFVVGMEQRMTAGGIALLEVKGQQLWGVNKEPDKADAVHPDYGRVFVTGRRREEADFLMLRKRGDRLDSDGPVSLERLRWN